MLTFQTMKRDPTVLEELEVSQKSLIYPKLNAPGKVETKTSLTKSSFRSSISRAQTVLFTQHTVWCTQGSKVCHF